MVGYLPDRIKASDKLWSQLWAMLPSHPCEDYLYWGPLSGEEILSADADAIHRLADLFNDLYGQGVVTTGYYEEDNEADERTGFYYCHNV